MKIQTQLHKTADLLSLSGSTLTINGTEYDLDNVQELPEGETHENQRVYKQGEDTIIFLHVDTELQFLAINHNLMRFFDIDENNLISMDELKIFVDHWNKPEAERKAERLAIMNEYLKTGTKEDWKKKGIPA
jgi:hypothetical protein